MAKPKFSQSSDDTRYVFPRSEEITIHRSDLQIQLQNFKERVLGTFSVIDFLSLFALWVPLISSDFKGVMTLTSAEVRAGYCMFAVILTIYILVSRLNRRVRSWWKGEKISADPKKMSQRILEQCASQKQTQ